MELEQMTQNKEKTSTDRIEKRVVLRAPRSRVWRALTRHDEFGKWFGVNLENGFAEGATVRGNITIKGYEHGTLELKIERLEPENLFSYRWHPYAVDPKNDYSSEPMTLVEFRLEDANDGTVLTIVESGFDRIPLARRAEAFKMNDGGWNGQIKNIERYVTQQ
ncbi:MAG: SRPBCC family protein [Gemmatimonadales bacterium]